ncbi:helix-turn-helix domain-containing protein [Flavobacterium sp. GA093]|uniref:Helix-turn-helix domain-containing protein n=1 Tax=Flavobacterium hydrocarbonoxydans TaxID=2683249 RepID=A0A6I4NJU2_9FLAO|nr:helix-turn-helix transcriptional regulator [Flavobacterium hydrocarbonoxydans]MWB93072.1 helix-turn-helix domain-containing protein [Flavobacterium hydrocarbonoxydans]
MVIGDKIKSIRKLKNYTQEYIAEQLGITQAGYSKIEKGKTRMSLEKLQQLSLILELPIEKIINFESQYYLGHRSIVDKRTDANSQNSFELLIRLYEDKIALLEKLLCKTDQELELYKQKCTMV